MIIRKKLFYVAFVFLILGFIITSDKSNVRASNDVLTSSDTADEKKTLRVELSSGEKIELTIQNSVLTIKTDDSIHVFKTGNISKVVNQCIVNKENSLLHIVTLSGGYYCYDLITEKQSCMYENLKNGKYCLASNANARMVHISELLDEDFYIASDNTKEKLVTRDDFEKINKGIDSSLENVPIQNIEIVDADGGRRSNILFTKIGESISLNCLVSPFDAANQNIRWKSSVPSVVTVDETGKVTSIANGTAVISSISEDGEHCSMCYIKVDAVGMYGDLSGDGKITATDLATVNKAINGMIVLSDEEKRICDLNGDGKVDETDLELLNQYILKTITVFPVENQLFGIEITSVPYKQVYYVGEELSKEGMVVTAVYGNGKRKEITKYEQTANMQIAGNKKVYVKYQEAGITKSATYDITVKEITTPLVTSSPTKTPSPSPIKTPSPSPIKTPSPSPIKTPSPSPTKTPSPSPTKTPSPSPTKTPSPSPTETPSPSPTKTPSPSPTETPSPNPTKTPSPSPTKTPSPSLMETSSPSPTETPSPSNTPVIVTETPIIQKKKQKITAKSIEKVIGSTFKIGATTDGNGSLTYKSANKKIASVSKSGIVKLKSYGKTTITITASETENCKAMTKKITITVVPKAIIVKTISSPEKKRITCTWKTNTSVDGYRVFISLKKDFRGETYERFYTKKEKALLLTGMKSGKIYYLKICGYKKVGNKRYYGAWSKVQKVKVK